MPRAIGGVAMNVFDYRERLIGEYRRYVESFINVANERLRETVQAVFDGESLWPQPLIQINPSFATGAHIPDLVKEGVLHPACEQVFRRNKTEAPGSGIPLRLHRHQEEAIRIAKERRSYVLTTGTGSGKSLAYIVPIVDRVLELGSGQGIKAIVVYPMNALANSQYGELDKFLRKGFPDGRGPVTFARYTGQESDEERQAIIRVPPDILLTNYVMLELILTRPDETGLVAAASGLEFIVLDELHTYRGRQGADVAMLLRRIRQLLGGDRPVQFVGTSATLAGTGTFEQQRTQVSSLAARLFGSPVAPTDVIGETLCRVTRETDVASPAGQDRLRNSVNAAAGGAVPGSFKDLEADPLSGWIESAFGLRDDTSSKRLVRTKPRALTGEFGAAAELSKACGLPEDLCRKAIANVLLAGATSIRHPVTGFPVFAFRLHQFISRGDTLYATVEDPDSRHVTIRGQQFSPEDASKILLPLCFCRECGHEFYSVWEAKDQKSGLTRYLSREAHDRAHIPGQEPGLLFVSKEAPWPRGNDPAVMDRLPSDWIEDDDGNRTIKRHRRERVPRPVRVKPDGYLGDDGVDAAFLPTPFVFCPSCGVAYNPRQRSDFPKIGTLGSEGRSSATTILTTTAVAQLRGEPSVGEAAQKVLSFTDNRQDASLQAGHLNDFLEVGFLRGALYRATSAAGAPGLRDELISQAVTDALGLDFENYAADPSVRFGAREQVNRTLRDVVGYRVYRDLRRGWRISAPNLEQCGLLEVDYASLDELCADQASWTACHETMAGASPDSRRTVCKTLLDFIRRDLCIDVNYLQDDFQEQIKRRCANDLCEPWRIEDAEAMEKCRPAFPCSEGEAEDRPGLWVSPKGGFGMYLRQPSTFGGAGLSVPDSGRVIRELFVVLKSAGIVKEVVPASGEMPVPGYMINPGALIWRSGSGKRVYHDRIRMPHESAAERTPNPFFVRLYRDGMVALRGIHAREHTAQVLGELREDRERAFRAGDLPILFCSPTMELGIDISDLNVVNMRNVPPTPANYAQRSGRAGRSGQPAFVFTYCAFGSPHDQYFFRHPELMVAGEVQTARIDITNEDLLRAHIHAIWLRETRKSLGQTPSDIVDMSGDDPTLDLKADFRSAVEDPGARARAHDRARVLLKNFEAELASTGWYHDDWLAEVINGVGLAFERTLDRWRSMYKAALQQARSQDKIIRDQSASPAARTDAARLRREAEIQLTLLADPRSTLQSDFYSYRYYASEGFLPGYNFPRLPLSALIPGRRGLRDDDEYISRPRFLAISEFGPGALIYHEGARYQVTRVTLPVDNERPGEPQLTQMKICPACGYMHKAVVGADRCERCHEELGMPMTQMFHMQNVVTRRRERISCDEEERLRMGYEIRTGIRFAERAGKPLFRSASVLDDRGQPLLTLLYGDAVHIWRINLGWSRRKKRDELGFVLDLERRQWTSNSIEPDDEDSGEEQKHKRIRVIPFVQDWRNALRVTIHGDRDDAFLASIETALKRAIQIEYQLEDTELASEPLPQRQLRKHLLIYEAAEGGAGVLRQLVSDPDAIPRVARRALEHLHFHPDTGEDLGKAINATERCQAACYDCLLSYFNQPDHVLLDRRVLKDFLMQLATGRVEASPGEIPRAEHMRQLKALCGSSLEREFLDFLEAHDLQLPTQAQHLMEEHGTRPDFAYLTANPAVIYVDGPPHDFPDRQRRDDAQQSSLEQSGYIVIRFHHRDNWLAKVQEHPSIFGPLK
jgi:hypothetical protein